MMELGKERPFPGVRVAQYPPREAALLSDASIFPLSNLLE